MGCVHSHPGTGLAKKAENDLQRIDEMSNGKSIFYTDKDNFLWKFQTEAVQKDTLYSYRNNKRVSLLPDMDHLLAPKQVLLSPDHQTVLIQMPFGEDDLFTIISKPFSWDFVRTSLFSLAEVVVFLHQHDMAHRDIKPENIVLYNNKLCLVDFDFCFPLRARAYCGTLYFRCPKKITLQWSCSSEESSKKMDVYSFGKLIMAIFWQASSHEMVGHKYFIFEAFHADFTESLNHPFTGEWAGWATVALHCLAKVPPSQIPVYLAIDKTTWSTENTRTVVADF